MQNILVVTTSPTCSTGIAYFSHTLFSDDSIYEIAYTESKDYTDVLSDAKTLVGRLFEFDIVLVVLGNSIHNLFPMLFLQMLKKFKGSKVKIFLEIHDPVLNDIVNESENIVELANFLGVDIFILQDKKFKLLHSSSSLNNILKNFLDVVILILFSPIFLFLIIIFSVLVFLFDGTPIFYTQDRVGIKGRQFKIFKFRTMKKIELTPEQIEELNEKSKVVFKSKKDPRITKFGSFLRKSSIDELPQIINILKNEMSFIGPRPPIPEEVLKYEIKHLKRVSVKPGITGLWQVTLRQDNDFDKWVQKDIEYIDNWSIFLDIKIALKTFKEIINLSGD